MEYKNMCGGATLRIMNVKDTESEAGKVGVVASSSEQSCFEKSHMDALMLGRRPASSWPMPGRCFWRGLSIRFREEGWDLPVTQLQWIATED